MIKAILIDDEKHCLEALENDLQMFCPEVVVVDACESAKEGLLSIKRNSPDLLFLDVEMPWMNGFELLETFREIPFQIIFTTAYDQFAARAFRVSAVDYLLKPIDGKDLAEAVAKVKKNNDDQEKFGPIPNLLQNVKVAAEQQRIAIPNRDGYEFVPVQDILYCRAEGPYTTFVLPNRSLLLTKSLGETERMLPATLFERVHHSLLVNLQHVNQYRKTNGSSIVMKNGDELTVAKSKKDQLLLRLGIRQ